MNADKISEDLFELLLPYGRVENGIDLGEVDSFEFIQIILGIEEAYGIVFDEEMMNYEILKDIPTLSSYIIEKLKNN